MLAETLTTPALLDRMARQLPDRPAVVAADRTLSFAQLRHEARRAAAAMMARGVRAADRVAIWSPNSWHWVVAALATHYAGAVLVPLNTRYTVPEAVDILARSRARLLLAGADRVESLDRAALPLLADVVRVPVAPGGTDWMDGPAVALDDVDARAAAVRPDDLADIFFTSGTTGRSKGVMCSHRQSLTATASVWSATGGLRGSDRYLCVNPFFHTFGYKFAVLACLQAGATLVPQGAFDPEAAMAAVAEQRITVFPAPPSVFQTLLDHPARDRYDTSTWRLAVTGATTLPVSLVTRMQQELGVGTVITGYGLTEASGYGTTCRPGDDPETVATTCGRPIPGFELRIGTAGEVLLRGPNVMLGYLDDPCATREAIDADGWLHTGDIGSVDGSGNLRVSGRIKDTYICGGFNVYPAEVEQMPSAMPGAAEAAVVGVPDRRSGETGPVPRMVTVVDALPRNASGNVQKAELRQSLREGAIRPAPLKPRGLGGPPVGHVETWVAEIWQVLLNIDVPGRRDKFIDLGGDSLAAAEFLRMLRTQFGVGISLDALAQRPTIAAVVAALHTGDDDDRQPVVLLREDDAGPICLMVPGLAGHAWGFAVLAEELAGPCDVRALSLMDLRHGPPGGFRSRIFAAAVAALQRDSGRPVVVIGYSFGALIAADIAGRLIEHEVPVAKLILLDPDPLDSSVSLRDFAVSRSSETHLIFVPGSPGARRLEAEITEVAVLLQQQYLDGSIRLPALPVAWLQSAPRAARDAGVPTLFGSPVDEIPRTVVDLDHLGMMRTPQVYELAGWLDDQLASL